MSARQESWSPCCEEHKATSVKKAKFSTLRHKIFSPRFCVVWETQVRENRKRSAWVIHVIASWRIKMLRPLPFVCCQCHGSMKNTKERKAKRRKRRPKRLGIFRIQHCSVSECLFHCNREVLNTHPWSRGKYLRKEKETASGKHSGQSMYM